MKKVLVVCTGNSCRSQMAEGYLRHFAGDRALIKSAGVEAHGVNPMAIAVMSEDGLDISGQTSNHIGDYAFMDFDFIITVCDNARETCPVFSGHGMRFHRNFPDPAKATGSYDQVMRAFRNTRDLIKDYCNEFVRNHIE